MGKHYLSVLFFFLTHLSFGQVKFTYDAAGNRISRVNQGPVQGCDFTLGSITGGGAKTCNSSVTLAVPCTGADCSGVTYTWSGNGISGTGTSKAFTAPATAGTYTYTVTASKSGCTSKTATVSLTVSCGGGGSCNYTNNQLLGTAQGNNIYVKVVGNCKYISFTPAGEAMALDWLYILVQNGTWASGVTPLTSSEIPTCFKQPGETCPGCTTPTAPVISASATSITSGQSSTLTATGCSGIITWSTGATGTQLVVNPTVTTSYTATCTVGSCTSSNSNSIQIGVGNPSDRLVVSVANITGQATTKKRVTIANPYSGSRTYLWYIYRESDMQYIANGPDAGSSNGVFDVDLASYNLTAGTVYRLYVGDTGDAGNTRHGYGTFTISNSNSNFTVQTSGGGSKACGSSATLSVSCSSGDCSGATYSWSGPNGFSSTQQSPVLTALSSAQAGTYTATVTKNGVSVSATLSLTVTGCGGSCNYTNNQLLGTAGDKQIYVKVVGNCKYISFTPGGEAMALDWLYVLVQNGTWASGVTPLTSSEIPTCFKQPGETCPGGSSCDFTLGSITGGGAKTCNSSVTLNVPCSGADCSGVTYTWSGNGISGTGASKAFTAPSTAGTYTYTVTASKSGCTDKTATVTLTVSCSGGGSCNYTHNQLLGTAQGNNIYVKVVGNCKYISFTQGGEAMALDWLYILVQNGTWASGVTPLTSSEIPTCFKQPGETCPGGSSCDFTLGSITGGGSKACNSSVTLAVACTGADCSGVTYTWSGNGISGTGASKAFTAPATAGSYTYTVTASKSGCTSKTATVTLTVSCSGGGSCNYTNNQLLGTAQGNNIYVKVVGNCKYISFTQGGEAMALDWLYILVQNGTWASGVTPLAASEIPSCFKQPGETCSGGCTTPTAPVISASATSINTGQSSTLTATGCSGIITWSTGATGTQLVVSPSVTTSYTATCTVGSCTSSNSNAVTVSVIPPSSDRLVVSVANITGQATTKKRVTIANPYSGSRTYLWYIYRESDMQYIANGPNTGSSNGVFDVDLASYNLTAGTVYRLYVGDTGDSGNSRHGYGTFTITTSGCSLSPPTITDVSSTSLTSGQRVSLIADGCAGGTITWSDGQTGQHITARPAQSVTYTATCTANGCTSAPSAPVTINVATTINPGCYRIQGYQSDKFLQDRGYGQQLKQYAANSQSNQLWKLESVGSGQMRISSPSNNYSWDISDAGTANGTMLKLWSYASGTNQKFSVSFVNDAYGAFRITPTHAPDKCVEMGGFSVADGGDAILQGYGGNGNQRWVFVPAGCPTSGAREAALVSPYESVERVTGTLLLIPNPAETTVELRLPATKELKQVWLLDMQGRSLRQTAENTLDVRELTVGSYLIRVQTQSGEIYQQLLIKK